MQVCLVSPYAQRRGSYQQTLTKESSRRAAGPTLPPRGSSEDGERCRNPRLPTMCTLLRFRYRDCGHYDGFEYVHSAECKAAGGGCHGGIQTQEDWHDGLCSRHH
ncbi:bfe10417-de2a-4924-88a0-c8719fc5c61f [Thermothielavioides terrestris]|uniref:Bfe10417-de2a-4924-88a0-c8719fc5c61f n=1 Tax=Thermothielavioides terrestris TaxID=2587410 RepID=A0A446B6C0_9PEZI|nr:bfe10417-de2a-4924-88a0-c8719fc5c61f [Thermothielavioides terrestris]